jgi:hypothetical protein
MAVRAIWGLECIKEGQFHFKEVTMGVKLKDWALGFEVVVLQQV